MKSFKDILEVEKPLETVSASGRLYIGAEDGGMISIGELRPGSKPNFRPLLKLAKQKGVTLNKVARDPAARTVSKEDWKILKEARGLLPGTIVATGPHLGFSIRQSSDGMFEIQYGRSYGSQSGLTLDQLKKTVNDWVKKEIKKTEKVMDELKFLNRFMAKRIDNKVKDL